MKSVSACHTAQRDSAAMVHLQYFNRCTPDPGFGNQPMLNDGEVVTPIVLAWLEQPCDPFCDRVDSCQVCAFVQVAIATCECQILDRALSPVLPRKDMLDVEQDA